MLLRVPVCEETLETAVSELSFTASILIVVSNRLLCIHEYSNISFDFDVTTKQGKRPREH